MGGSAHRLPLPCRADGQKQNQPSNSPEQQPRGTAGRGQAGAAGARATPLPHTPCTEHREAERQTKPRGVLGKTRFRARQTSVRILLFLRKSPIHSGLGVPVSRCGGLSEITPRPWAPIQRGRPVRGLQTPLPAAPSGPCLRVPCGGTQSPGRNRDSPVVPSRSQHGWAPVCCRCDCAETEVGVTRRCAQGHTETKALAGARCRGDNSRTSPGVKCAVRRGREEQGAWPPRRVPG